MIPLLLGRRLERDRRSLQAQVGQPCLDNLRRYEICRSSDDITQELATRPFQTGKGKRRRTNLVQDEDELFPATVERSEFALDSATPGPDGVARVEHLDDDVAHLKHLAERLGVQFQARVLDLAFALVHLIFLVVQHGVLAGLSIGGESGSEGGGRSESGALLVGRLGCLSPLELLLLDLRARCHISRGNEYLVTVESSKLTAMVLTRAFSA